MRDRDFIYRRSVGTPRKRPKESFEARERRVVLSTLRAHALDRGELELQSVSAGDLVAEAMDSLTTSGLPGNEIAFTGGDSTGRLAVRANRSWLLCALEYLIRSATRALAGRGHVEIMAQPFRFNPNEVQFSVWDNGASIPQENLTRMLARSCETFPEAEDPEDQRGLGFALMVTKAVVEAHGGRLWVESEPSEGTTVYFTLPLDRASHQPHGI